MIKNFMRTLKHCFFPWTLTADIKKLERKRQHNQKLLKASQELSKNYLQFDFMMLEISYYYEYKNNITPEEVIRKFEYYKTICMQLVEELEELGETISQEIKASIFSANLQKYTCFQETMDYIKNLQDIMNNYMPSFKI